MKDARAMIRKGYSSDGAILVKGLLAALLIHFIFALLFKDGNPHAADDQLPLPGVMLLDFSDSSDPALSHLSNRLKMLDPTAIAGGSNIGYVAREPLRTAYQSRPEWQARPFTTRGPGYGIAPFDRSVLTPDATDDSFGLFGMTTTLTQSSGRAAALPAPGLYLDGKRLEVALPPGMISLAAETNASAFEMTVSRTSLPAGEEALRFSILQSTGDKELDLVAIRFILNYAEEMKATGGGDKPHLFKVRWSVERDKGDAP